MNTEQPLVHMEGITKRFAGVTANFGINFEVRRGKSTHFSEKTAPANQR